MNQRELKNNNNKNYWTKKQSQESHEDDEPKRAEQSQTTELNKTKEKTEPKCLIRMMNQR